MGDLYEKVSFLCNSRGITVYKMCKEIGIRGSILSDLNCGRKKNLSAETLSKIADYFGVTVDYLLHGEQNVNAPADVGEGVSDSDIKFALFGGDGEITDEMYAEVKSFAQYVKQRERDKQK